MKIHEAKEAVQAKPARVVLGKREITVLEKAADVLAELPDNTDGGILLGLNEMLVCHARDGALIVPNGRVE